jgi:hypothetical protein
MFVAGAWKPDDPKFVFFLSLYLLRRRFQKDGLV